MEKVYSLRNCVCETVCAIVCEGVVEEAEDIKEIFSLMEKPMEYMNIR